MYLLENTGDFVRSNELQEGDFIVIYSDVKSGKYLIRGVKVRPTQEHGNSSSGSVGKHKHGCPERATGVYDARTVVAEDGRVIDAAQSLCTLMSWKAFVRTYYMIVRVSGAMWIIPRKIGLKLLILNDRGISGVFNCLYWL